MNRVFDFLDRRQGAQWAPVVGVCTALWAIGIVAAVVLLVRFLMLAGQVADAGGLD